MYTADGPITGWIEDGKDLKNSKPLPKLHSADGCEHELGAGWKVGVLVARYSENSGFPWNHGETTGIAINEEEKKVLYYAETWRDVDTSTGVERTTLRHRAGVGPLSLIHI